MHSYFNYYSLFQFQRDENQHNTNSFNIIEWLAHSLNQVTTKFLGYLINNYRFNTKHMDEQRITQNSGMCIDVIIKYKRHKHGD